MIYSENRLPLFGIMRWRPVRQQSSKKTPRLQGALALEGRAD